MGKSIRNRNVFIVSAVLLASSSGCVSVPVENPDDPWESWNRGAQQFNDDFDENIMKPLAKGYLVATPEPVDRGISNFFSNIDDIGVTLNDALQWKVQQAGMDMGRFLLNTTVGVAGFIDVATDIGLPKHNEDFEQTLGVWGVSSGPYLVIPFWGPSSPRGVGGLIGDAAMDPVNYTVFGGVAANVAGTASDLLDVTDRRAGLMTTEKIVDEAAIDRYAFIRNSYQQHREYLVNDGNIPEDDLLEPIESNESEGMTMEPSQ
ncbi:VacJ family lipoprotein [Methylomarinum sp. Ch1-1]|uniref:VacJ family lipoprotein n=1 Tax=Methylomarinum roseum TaxID=3067653 RepID=A0AAU7NR04_9GAMM|nr:VacJ family lipoprotein [Methylomarinum sp. Ch1-1]MDP4520641.1 VacJ family lipoprotein [Methylomarinum sp. Ch1-1]